MIIYLDTIKALASKYGTDLKTISKGLGYDQSWLSGKFTHKESKQVDFTELECIGLCSVIGCTKEELALKPISEITPEDVKGEGTAALPDIDLLRKEMNANADNLYQEVRGLREDLRELAKAQHTDLMQIYKILAMPSTTKTTATGKILG